jgi:hypothetical protein
LSLSRLNHRLPGCETHPEVVQGATACHHPIADALLPQADPVFDDPTTLDTTVDMLDAQPAVVQRLMRPLLRQRSLLAAWLLDRHEDLHLRERKRQEAQILPQPAPRRQGIRRRVSNGLIMGAAAIGVAQKEDDEQGIDEQDIFDGVVLFRAAITRGLFRRVFGADAAPLGAVMGKRGEAGAAVGTAPPGGSSSASGVTTVAASASETPQRCARAVRERAGASPRVRRAARKTGKRTWSH